MQIEILKSDIKANLCNLIDNDYVLLDLPYHINTGDLLIWEGELFFLKDHIHHKMLGYYNVSTFNFPDKTSAGKTPSSLASIICSQSLVELGITKPNLNLELSNNSPIK